MKVLIVEPMKPCYVREISGLNDMQEIVGGHIEAIYPFMESRMTSSAGRSSSQGWVRRTLFP